MRVSRVFFLGSDDLSFFAVAGGERWRMFCAMYIIIGLCLYTLCSNEDA